jgi:hypothetical protein
VWCDLSTDRSKAWEDVETAVDCRRTRFWCEGGKGRGEGGGSGGVVCRREEEEVAERFIYSVELWSETCREKGVKVADLQ